jgi:hypothetical protein
MATTIRRRALAALLALTFALGATTPAAVATPGGSLVAGYEPLALLTGTRLTAALPEFGAVMGYEPEVITLAGSDVRRAVKPSGSCSSPLGGTPFGFTPACKAHDLGYDLLRYADRTGTPAGPGARKALDRRFEADLHAHCAETREGLARRVCGRFAGLYARVAALNSWRQRYGVP